MKEDQNLLKPAEVAEWLQVPVQTLYAWRYSGDGPPSHKVGRHVRYIQEEVEKWVRIQQ